MSQTDDPRLRFDFPDLTHHDSVPEWGFALTQNDEPLVMTAARIEVRDRAHKLVHVWSSPDTITITPGRITASAVPDTSAWPYGDHRYNLQVTLANGLKRSVATGSFTFGRP